MPGLRTHRVRGRLLPAVVAAACGLVGLTALAPNADASVAAPKGRYTATVSSPDTATSPVVATVATPVTLSFLLTNTSVVNASVQKFTLTAPTGFAVSSASVGLPGWTATILGQVVTVKVAHPRTTSFLKPGQSLTVTLVTTASASAADPNLIQTPATFTVVAYSVCKFIISGPQPGVLVVAPGTASFPGTPGVPLTDIKPNGPGGGPCLLDPTNPICSSANLPNGAVGNVYFLQRPCVFSESDPTCTKGTEVELSGNFSNLYSVESPGQLTLTCLAATCPHADQDPANQAYNWNFSCSDSTCVDGLNNPFGEREVEEDFQAYPIYVQLKGGSGFVQAPRCVPINDLTTTGHITDAAAKGLGFCVDVNAITRLNNSFDGNLVVPVNFVEDPKMRF